PESEKLLAEVMTTLDRQPNTRAVIVPRTPKQGKELQAEWPTLFENGKAIIPEHAVDGLDLIWNSDLVISGGGRMKREAASLGVPVYSIFRGKLGSVDKYLAEKGRLVLLQSVDDVRNKLKIVRRPRAGSAAVKSDALRKVVDNIVEVLGRKG